MIYLIIIGCYLAYFLFQIIYDSFIVKSTKIVDDDDLNIIQHDHVNEDEITAPENITLDSIESTKSESSIKFDDLEEKQDDDLTIDLNKKNQEENYLENFEENIILDKTINIENSKIEEKNENFISNFEKLLKGNTLKTIPIEDNKDDLDIINIINDSNNITSFSYSNISFI